MYRQRRPIITPQTVSDDLPELLTVKEVAAYLGCNPLTIYEAIRRGELDAKTFAGGKQKYIAKSVLLALIHAGKPAGAERAAARVTPQPAPGRLSKSERRRLERQIMRDLWDETQRNVKAIESGELVVEFRALEAKTE